MRKMRTQDSRHTRAAFTLAEVMIVIIIIVIMAVISLTAYFGVLRGAKERAAASTLKTLASAVQAFYNENRDYPAMRFRDLGVMTLTGTFPSTPLANVDYSAAVLVYQLQYRSSAGDLIKNLPSSVLVPLNVTATDAGQIRPLYTLRDPWGNAIQYLRPYGTDQLSAANLANRVLLVSMGKDGNPGQEGTDAPAEWPDPDDGNIEYPNPTVLKLGKADDVLVQVGSAQ